MFGQRRDGEQPSQCAAKPKPCQPEAARGRARNLTYPHLVQGHLAAIENLAAQSLSLLSSELRDEQLGTLKRSSVKGFRGFGVESALVARSWSQ